MSKVTSFVFICVLSLLGEQKCHGLKTVHLQSPVIATAFTPFDKYEKLDLSMIPKIAQYYKANNIKVVYISAYYGGGPSLSLDERKALASAWAYQSNCLGFDLMIEIGAAPFVQVLEFAKYCSQLNVTALTAFSEIVYQPETPNELLEDLEKICSAAPNIPLFSHEFSVVDQEIGPVQDYLSACNKVSCYAGVIASIDRLLAIRASRPDTACQFLTDTNEQIVASLLLQADGAASPGITLCPGLALDCAKAVAEGNRTRALECQKQLDDVVAAVVNLNGGRPTDDTSRTYFENLKAAYCARTGICTGVRYPQETPNATDYERIRSNLADCNCY